MCRRPVLRCLLTTCACASGGSKAAGVRGAVSAAAEAGAGLTMVPISSTEQLWASSQGHPLPAL